MSHIWMNKSSMHAGEVRKGSGRHIAEWVLVNASLRHIAEWVLVNASLNDECHSLLR